MTTTGRTSPLLARHGAVEASGPDGSTFLWRMSGMATGGGTPDA